MTRTLAKEQFPFYWVHTTLDCYIISLLHEFTQVCSYLVYDNAFLIIARLSRLTENLKISLALALFATNTYR